MNGNRAARLARTASLHALLPSEATLVDRLSTILAVHGGWDVGSIAMLGRQPNLYASTFPSEIVTCCSVDGRELRLLCKYGAGQSHTSHGHRGDVCYEADVYRYVIEPLHSSAARFYGSHTGGSGDTWLVLEFVDDAVRVSHAPPRRPHPARLAARWIAQFHGANISRVNHPSLRFLKVYDGDYYRQWAQRTAVLGSQLHDRLRWLAPLCAQFISRVDLLLDAPTAIHGEYTPKNTLVQDQRICPVDWESAAIAAGEIDLATLTDGNWSPEIVADCVEEYQRVRWPHGVPPEFAEKLGIARLYWSFRWLGERLDWTVGDKSVKRLQYLRAAGEQMALI